MKVNDAVVTKQGVGTVDMVLPSGFLIKTRIGARYTSLRFYTPSEVKKA